MDRTTTGAAVCALAGASAVFLWAGLVAMTATAIGRGRGHCPAWCPCRAEADYLDSAEDSLSRSPNEFFWRSYRMPIQRGDDSGNESRG